MDNTWQQLLDDTGAVRDADGRILHFGNPVREQRAATGGSVICELSGQALIRAAGPDAVTFLQGQLTNDVAAVDPARSQLSGYCTPKGRLITVFRLFARDDAIFLALPRSQLESTLERLRKYVLMSKLTLEPVGDALAGLGLSGPRCEQELAAVTGGAVPATVDDCVNHDGLTVIRIPGRHPRFEIHGPPAAVARAWSQLDVHAAPVGDEAWTLLDILAGVPAIAAATEDEFIPQTLNLDLLDAISFSKGCYTGQEIVARLHYRGKVKRRMYLAHCDADTPPAPGVEIHAADGDGQAIGRVVMAATAPPRGCQLLASISVEQAATAATTAGALRLGAADGPALTLEDLPALAAGAAP